MFLLQLYLTVTHVIADINYQVETVITNNSLSLIPDGKTSKSTENTAVWCISCSYVRM